MPTADQAGKPAGFIPAVSGDQIRSLGIRGDPVLRGGISLLRRDADKTPPFDQIPGSALRAGDEARADPEVRFGVPAGCGLAIERDCQRRIARDAQAFFMEDAKPDLRIRITLIGGAPIPTGRFDVILHDTEALFINQSKARLSIEAALVGGEPEQTRRLLIVLNDAEAFQVQYA